MSDGQRRLDGVKQERSGWRCEEISRRHREWGYNCPAVDLDFLVVEYNYGTPVALIEYKNRNYRSANTSDRTYDALTKLADNYSPKPLPFFVVVYDPADWWFIMHPMNDEAKRVCRRAAGQPISEQEFVQGLYRLRKRALDQRDKEAIARLNNVVPMAAKGEEP